MIGVNNEGYIEKYFTICDIYNLDLVTESAA